MSAGIPHTAHSSRVSGRAITAPELSTCQGGSERRQIADGSLSHAKSRARSTSPVASRSCPSSSRCTDDAISSAAFSASRAWHSASRQWFVWTSTSVASGVTALCVGIASTPKPRPAASRSMNSCPPASAGSSTCSIHANWSV